MLSVTDDDGGADSESAGVDVLTPEQAVEEILDLLDGVIASTTDNNVRKDLEKARKALAGSNAQGSNGALAMIRAGNDGGGYRLPARGPLLAAARPRQTAPMS